MNNTHIFYNINMTYTHHEIGILPQLILILPFMIGLVLYPLMVIYSNRRYKQWPIYRTACWITGFFCAAVAVAGPLAQRAHTDFAVHMTVHLLLGMLAPLLMALAAPMTLIMRTLSTTMARRLSRILKSWPVRMVSDPITASLLNVGGLWLLYTTELYTAMHQHITLHIFIHTHVFLAGYLFTISLIYIDPTSHRTSYVYRSIVLIAALAGHGILSKYIYAHPPSNVPASQAEVGSMLMYYGGDAIDIFIIFILCLQWYKAKSPRISLSMAQHPRS